MELPEGAQVKAPWGFMSPGAFLRSFLSFPLPGESFLGVHDHDRAQGGEKNENDFNRGRGIPLETAFHDKFPGPPDFHAGANGSVRRGPIRGNSL